MLSFFKDKNKTLPRPQTPQFYDVGSAAACCAQFEGHVESPCAGGEDLGVVGWPLYSRERATLLLRTAYGVLRSVFGA